MAEPSENQPQRPMDIIAQALADTQIQGYVELLRNRVRRIHRQALETTDLEDSDYAYDSVAHLIISTVNGSIELPEQRVNVEYLRNDQRMVIPLALGMHWNPTEDEPGRVAGNALLRTRYWGVSTIQYHELRSFVTPTVRATELRAYVTTRDTRSKSERCTIWDSDAWYVLADGTPETEAARDMTMALVSLALQFNCDIRDFGFLNREDASITDYAWQTADTVPLSRTNNKLRGMTLQAIASLNYEAVGKVALAAWVRAYGLGMGILPSVDSATVREFHFTSLQVQPASRAAIQQYERQYERPVFTLCANIIAMFGLFHLSKDHTFRTADPNMLRIGVSYIMALRTDATATTVDYMKMNQEAIVRTAAHPFGLAQTYWLAKVMAKHGRLMLPLMCRVDVTPPPVQRLMIIDAAAREWDGIPAGKQGSLAYTTELQTIRAEIEKIKANPPAYSGLHRLYGIPSQALVSAEATEAVKAMMPCVFGFIMITHVDEKDVKDGLGYALSLGNVQRDARGTVLTWQHAWENYVSGIDRTNLVDVFRQIAIERAVDGGGGANA